MEKKVVFSNYLWQRVSKDFFLFLLSKNTADSLGLKIHGEKNIYLLYVL